MPRITHSKSGQAAKSYFQQSDYYSSGQELRGHWFGKGAELLGLSGEVNQEQFERLVDNKRPLENTQLTVRTRDDRRPGADVTFSAPKSVSILWGATGDNAISEAVYASACETMIDMEQDAQTRVNPARNVMYLAKTGNIVGASWLHTTSRPVGGNPPDPNLHVHCWTANATMSHNRWTALDMSAMVRDSKYYDALFMSRLASKLNQLGYPTERSKHNFEITGIDRSTIEKFSKRTAEIDRLAEELGITNADTKDKLGATTRQKKTKALDPTALSAYWRTSLTDDEQQGINRIAKKHNAVAPSMTANQAVDYSVAHLFERESVVRKRQLVTEALFHGMGQVTVGDVQRDVEGRSWLREGKDEKALLSTHDILREEQKLLAYARSGRGSVAPLVAKPELIRQWLSDEQKHAVLGLLRSTDRLQIFRGRAGTGKTTTIAEVVHAIDNVGTHVVMLAPSGKATDILKKEGFEAKTLQSFLVNQDAQAEAKNSVICCDEAGLIGTPTLAKLFDVAKDLNARIILMGDSAQHTPVERGHALRLLEDQAGIVPKQLTEIRRQEGTYREAVSLLSKGKIGEGFDLLNQEGFVHELSDDERYLQLAKDYVSAREDGKSTLVIAPSHAERDIVTKQLRDVLKSRGHVTGPEHIITILKSKQLTKAERSDAFNYTTGDVVEFIARGKGGFMPGDRLTIVSNDQTTVTATNAKGALVSVPLVSPGAFEVYQPELAKFAVGDTIRLAKNRRPMDGCQRLTNGSVYELKGFTAKGKMMLKDGPTIDPSWGHFEHGICVTSYGSQGASIQRVFVAQSSLSFGASSPQQAYVSNSRGRERLDLYTDNAAELRAAISRDQPKRLASELIPLRDPLAQPIPSRLHTFMQRWRVRSRNFANATLRQVAELFPQPAIPQRAR